MWLLKFSLNQYILGCYWGRWLLLQLCTMHSWVNSFDAFRKYHIAPHHTHIFVIIPIQCETCFIHKLEELVGLHSTLFLPLSWLPLCSPRGHKRRWFSWSLCFVDCLPASGPDIWLHNGTCTIHYASRSRRGHGEMCKYRREEERSLLRRGKPWLKSQIKIVV